MFGRKVLSAKLEFENDFWGGVVHPVSPAKRSLFFHGEIRAYVEQELMIACAGICAELKLMTPESQWADIQPLKRDIAFILDGPLGPPPMLGVEDDYQRVGHLLDVIESRCFVSGGRILSTGLRYNVRDFAILRTVEILNHTTVWQTVESLARNLVEKNELATEEIEKIAQLHELDENGEVFQFSEFHFKNAYPFN